MCLHISQRTVDKKTNRYKNRKKPFFVYKSVIRDMATGRYLSPYRKNHHWKRGTNISDRAQNYLSPSERITKAVHKGLHFYTNKDEAFREERCMFRDRIILKCKVYPEDVVAVGNFCGVTSLVATKCIMIGKAKRRPGDK